MSDDLEPIEVVITDDGMTDFERQVLAIKAVMDAADYDVARLRARVMRLGTTTG